MPVTDAYSDAGTYRARLGKQDNGQDPAILDDMIAVSRMIDSICDRENTGFNIDAAPTARVYYPRGYHGGDPEAENPWRGVRGARLLDVDEIGDTTGLSIIIDENRTGSFAGYTALASTDYQMFPLNADKGPAPSPFTQIYIPTWSTKFGWPPGCPVQVTAKYGYAAVPPAIKRATEQLTGILRLDTPRATERIPEAMQAAIAESPTGQKIIDMLLATYRRDRLYA